MQPLRLIGESSPVYSPERPEWWRSREAVTAVFALLFAWVSAAQVPSQTSPAGQPAELYGSILDSSGKTLAGVTVSADQLSTFDKKRIFSRYYAVTNAAGGFEFKNLPAGVYRICPKVPGSTHVEPCLWSTNVPTASLSPGQLWYGFKITMPQGQRIHVRIDDDDKHLQNAKKKATSQTRVKVSIGSKFGFRELDLAHADSGGDSYFVTVPRNVPVSVSVRGQNVEFQETQGNRKVDLKDRKDDSVEFKDNDGPKEIRVSAVVPKK